MSALWIIKLRLKHEFTYHWHSMVNTPYSKHSKRGANKLRTYKLFKQHFKRECYLEIPNRLHQKALAQFRLSAHRLKIETGRYNGRNQYIPPDQRICQSCTLSETENEIHFAIKCPAYSSIRAELFQKITTLNTHFGGYTDEQKFVWLLTKEIKNSQQHLAHFIYEATKIHRNKLQNV